MREYLFRGQRIGNGKWVEGFYVHQYNCHAIHLPDDAELVDGCFVYENVIPETVGQYTGLKDKNGKRIFEGDVIKGEFLWSDIVGQVVWGEYSHSKCDEYSCEHYGWYVKPIREVKNNLYENTGWDLHSMDMVEVIGNIHDTEGGAE